MMMIHFLQRKFLNPPNWRSMKIALIILVVLFLGYNVDGESEECSSPGCVCYNFEDGLFLECSGATEDTLRAILLKVLNMEGKFHLIKLEQFIKCFRTFFYFVCCRKSYHSITERVRVK